MGNAFLNHIVKSDSLLPALEQLLTNYGIRFTNTRLAVLYLFKQENKVLSLHELEYILEADVDRSTIFRTLQLFWRKGIIYQIWDGKQIRYAWSGEGSNKASVHLIFKCEQCLYMFELDTSLVPSVHLPSGYKCEKQNYLLKGVCKQCNSANSEDP